MAEKNLRHARCRYNNLSTQYLEISLNINHAENDKKYLNDILGIKKKREAHNRKIRLGKILG